MDVAKRDEPLGGPEPKLDTLVGVETPEGVRLVLRPAGPVARGMAFLLDAGLRTLGYGVVLIPIGMTLPDLAVAATFLVLFVGEWFYPVLFEVYGRGQTPGKRATGLRVLHEDGSPIGWPASLLRNLLLAADFMPGTYAVGLVSCAASRGFRRLGDHAAGTLVVHDAALGPADRPPSELPPAPPPWPLALEEQRAVVAFAERAGRFSPARADELARLSGALVEGGGGAPERPSRRLRRLAAWLTRPPSAETR